MKPIPKGINAMCFVFMLQSQKLCHSSIQRLSFQSRMTRKREIRDCVRGYAWIGPPFTREDVVTSSAPRRCENPAKEPPPLSRERRLCQALHSFTRLCRGTKLITCPPNPRLSVVCVCLVCFSMPVAKKSTAQRIWSKHHHEHLFHALQLRENMCEQCAALAGGTHNKGSSYP